VVRGLDYAQKFPDVWQSAQAIPAGESSECNPLTEYFDAYKEGPGIWKWRHYFDIYHRHFSKFIGKEVHILEIGVYSGGSLGMWRSYFGEGCSVYGVDIEEACRAYEANGARIFIGDQEDRGFWGKFKQDAPTIDIVIDDGGHLPDQQIVTLEELLPHIRPGGVYLCEDLHGEMDRFISYVHGVTQKLNDFQVTDDAVRANAFQNAIHSVHHYPFVVVIEKLGAPRQEFRVERRGTHWEPFL
jgi:hypothetical protein